MKAFVLVVVLLLQQVMGDANTQLVTQASNQFASKLYQELAQKPDNVLVCPISLHVALALVHQGAGGSTASELASVLKLDAASNADIKESYKAVLQGIQDDVLKIANKLYPAAGYQLSPDYLSVARDYFLSDVEGLNYSDPNGAAGTINKFVAEKTNNKIHDLISADSITDLTKLIIVNAVHFQATWKNTFTTSYEDYFRVTPDKKVKTTLMTQTSYYDYKEDPVLRAKVLKMDYKEKGYSMVFILPEKEDGLTAVEAKLANTNLESILKDLTETRVEVTIPKFKVEQTIQLKEILQKMGLKEVFSSRANLQGLANGDNLYVSDVIQKTFINVHENGTEAAAATVFLETLSANPDLTIFYATRPFHYYLINRKSALVLFEGRFVRPMEQSPSGRPVVSQQDNFVFVDKPSDADRLLKPGQTNVGNAVPVTPTPQTWQQQNQQWQQQNEQWQQQNQRWQQHNQQQQQQQQNQNWEQNKPIQNQDYNTQHFQNRDPNQNVQGAFSPQVGHQAQPGYPQPVAQPGNSQPVAQPGYSQPVAQPGYPQPVAQPGNSQPVAQPGYSQLVAQPGYSQPMAQPGYSQLVAQRGYPRPQQYQQQGYRHQPWTRQTFG